MLRKSVLFISFSIILTLISSAVSASPASKGIYINQGTLENTTRLNYLIKESKAVGINTFVVDLERVTPHYKKNIDLIKSNGIKYVARIVVFPDGGRSNHVKSRAYWEKRLTLVNKAMDFGANAIQLDYVRYSSKVQPSAQNAKDVKEVIKFFKQKTAARGVPLQIDVFGEVSFKESPRIGQNIKLFADTIDVACPMVYPSHYAPYQQHSKEPYKTVLTSLEAMKKQFANNKTPFKLNPYIEASNYHYKLSTAQKAVYVMAQIRAVEDAKADGWYVWSPNNHYDHLFSALKNRSSSNQKVKLTKAD
jgi:hypothetical protein